MADTVKKASSTKAPAKARKTAAPKNSAPTTTENGISKTSVVSSTPAASNVTNGKSVAPASNVTPIRYSHDQVAQLAHKYWAERGRRDGHHLEDWFRAEQELRSKAS